MVRKISISIGDYVDDKINNLMVRYGYTNKSELCEELLRLGILEFLKLKDGDNGE